MTQCQVRVLYCGSSHWWSPRSTPTCGTSKWIGDWWTVMPLKIIASFVKRLSTHHRISTILLTSKTLSAVPCGHWPFPWTTWEISIRTSWWPWLVRSRCSGKRQDFFCDLLSYLFSRRFIWNFFRLENEHLNNCGEFRAVRDISIAPISTHPANNNEPVNPVNLFKKAKKRKSANKLKQYSKNHSS